MSSKSRVNNELLSKSSFSSASSLVALQLFSRIFTFVLNQALFRLASPRAYGTVAIQFELMLSTILFISREGVRNSLLRVNKPGSSTSNLSTLPLIFGIPLALATSSFYAFSAGSEVRNQAHFNASICIYAIAAVIELMSEPLHNLAMAELRTNVRVRAEGLGITGKTIVAFLILVYDARRRGGGTLALLAFAIGQLAYGTIVLGAYIACYGTRHLWQRMFRIKAWHTFDPELLRLALTMTSQSVVKLLLTEGDKAMLSWFSPLQDQGGYAIAVNYGSLIARIIFQPVEETSRIYFSKILSTSSNSKSARGILNEENLRQAATTFISILSVQCSMSIVLLVFGTTYMPLALHILLPTQYLSTSAPKVLSAWIWYIPVLAFNGILEAFFSSVATPNDLNKQSRWLAGFSVSFILAAIAFYALQLGDVSLVYANILNLSARIIYCALFMSSFFAKHNALGVLKWSKALPTWSVILTSTLSAVFIWMSSRRLEVLIREEGRTVLLSLPIVIHVLIGGVMGVVCLAAWWTSSGRYLSISSRPKSE